jgi:hypothetical protein
MHRGIPGREKITYLLFVYAAYPVLHLSLAFSRQTCALPGGNITEKDG